MSESTPNTEHVYRTREAAIAAAYDALMERAHALGAEQGRAAASWYFDGNTTTEQYERVLRGIEEGDPATYDTFPNGPLSGEWAGDPLPADVLAELEIEEDDDRADDALRHYEDGFGVAVSYEIERAARAYLATDLYSEFGIRRLAKAMAGRFTQRTRDDETRYTTLSDGAEPWMRDVVQDAHNGMLPDDWRYDAIAAAVEFIADRDDWEDASYEFANDQVDVYDSDVIAWFASHSMRRDYCEEAADEYGSHDGPIVEAMQRGQVIEAIEVLTIVARALEGLADEQ